MSAPESGKTKFSKALLQQIAQAMIYGGPNGMPQSMQDIAGKDGIPPMSELLEWFKPTFKHYEEWIKEFEWIKKMQVEIKLDKIDSIREGARDKNTAFSTRVQLEQIRWEAQKTIPERYSVKSESRGSRTPPMLRFKRQKKRRGAEPPTPPVPMPISATEPDASPAESANSFPQNTVPTPIRYSDSDKK